MSIIAIYGSRRLQPYLSQLDTLLEGLAQMGWSLAFAEKVATFLDEIGFALPPGSVVVKDVSELPSKPVLAISIGGDGTFLNTARWVGAAGVPVLGLNAGHLGFLATFNMEDPDKVLDAISRQLLHVEERMLLEVTGAGIRDYIWPYALNEVAISRPDNGSMITARTFVDGFFLGEYVADGLIISSPTGSTGYNLSVGGPILQPSLDAIVLSPIAPHTLTLRPVVVDATSEIVVETMVRAPKYRVAIDGKSFMLSSGSRITIRKAPFKLLMLRRPSENFADTLREKLLWGRR